MEFHHPGYFPEVVGTTTIVAIALDTVFPNLEIGTDNATNVSSSVVTSESATRTAPYSLAEIILIAIVAGLLSLITVLGNVMVMISFKLDKQLQTISNYFLLSLAIADFLIGLISMPLFTMYLLYDQWPLGPLICDTWLAFDYLNSNASVLNLLVISFDRYFSVTRPLTYRVRRTTKRAAFMIACAWIISLALWPPWIYSWPYIEGQRTVPEDECYIQFLQTNSYLTFGTAIAAFYVPVTVMCVLYWRVWRETEQRKKDLSQLQAEKKEGSKKSTSSDDPNEIEDLQRKTRSASVAPEESVETTYVPTSMCVETTRYLRSSRRARPKRLKEIFWTWCRIDKDGEVVEEESTEHGSPVTTPASVETPLQTVSRNTSMNFSVPQHHSAHHHSSMKKTEPPIPMTDRNGPKIAEVHATPSTSKSPTTHSLSTESVYTILIRLPPGPKDDKGSEHNEGISQASIKMILEEGDYEDEIEAETSLQTIRTSVSTSALTGSRQHHHINRNVGSLRSSEPSLETIRLPLNTKLVPKQIAKTRGPKKKRKQQERKQEKKAAKTLSAILLAFIITWTPYNVLVLIKTLSRCENDKCIPVGLWNFAYYLCYINSLVNPLCYALCNANFRRTYIRILSCKWHGKNRNVFSRGYFS